MANLSPLKGTILTTILIPLIGFVAFLSVVSFFFTAATDLSFSPLATLAGAFAPALVFMLIQFAISPHLVAATARLHYLQPSENPWLESTVGKLASQPS